MDAVAARTNIKQALPFFGISNMESSLRFYIDGLGFKMTRKWIVDDRVRWCWLDLDEVALMLQEHRGRQPDSWEAQGKVGVGVSICFQCEDALAFYREVKSRGIETQKLFVGNAMWVVDIADPDGYRLSFESPPMPLKRVSYRIRPTSSGYCGPSATPCGRARPAARLHIEA